MGDWYQNSKAIQSVSVDDRGLHYGDGLFETIAVRDGSLRNWSLHMDRLARGCGGLNLDVPEQDELLENVVDSLRLSQYGSEDCVIKIVVTAGAGQRGYGRDSDMTPNCLIGVSPAESLDEQLYRDGVDVIRCRSTLAMHSPLAGIKTLNRLEQVLARSEVLQADAFEGLTMDANDNVLSGTMSNVFFIQDNAVLTPDLSQAGIHGTMRAFVIASLWQEAIDVSQRTVTESEIASMDEAFLCNSQFGILPIRDYDGHEFGGHSMTNDVMAVLASRGIQECQL